jgi:hypothetical protein
MAKAIGKELNIIPEDVKANPKMGNIDLLYIVSGIYGNKSSPELIDYVTKLTKRQAKKVALITSSCAKTAKPTDMREILNKNGIEVLKDEFVYPGGLLFFGGHPNKEDMINAINFAKKLAK